MCCVIPPNSRSATLVVRMASSSEVLPWSTWPMTVTTGGRGRRWVGSASSSSRISPSSDRTSTSKWNRSATSRAAVASSTSLTVAMTPSSSSALITSTDFRRMAAASSPTVTDSGSLTSSRLISCGGSGMPGGATGPGPGRAAGPGRQRRGRGRGSDYGRAGAAGAAGREIAGGGGAAGRAGAIGAGGVKGAARLGATGTARTSAGGAGVAAAGLIGTTGAGGGGGVGAGGRRRQGRGRDRQRRGGPDHRRVQLGNDGDDLGHRGSGGCRGTEDGGRRLDRLNRGLQLGLASRRLGRHRLQDPLPGGFLHLASRPGRRGLSEGLCLGGNLFWLGRTLGLALDGQVATAPELDPQLVGRVGGHRRHRPHALLSHALESHDQILTGDSQLLREVDDLYTCRQSALTSSARFPESSPRSRPEAGSTPGEHEPTVHRASAFPRHASLEQAYAPRPAAAPSGSTLTRPSASRTSRMRSTLA